MKNVILVILLITSYCSLSAGTPYFETQMNSDANDFPLVYSGEMLYFLCDRTDMELEFLSTTEQNIPYFYNIYSVKDNEAPWKETKKFCIKSNQFPAFYSNSLNIAFTTEISNKTQYNNLYNQSLYEQFTCDNSEYSLALNRYGYWTGQPALSPSGKVLVFSSNRDAGRTKDLYASIKDENGMWGTPIYLDQLNTEGDEINPHFGVDGYFYYASNFKNDSLKDFDIYKATYVPKDGVLMPFDGKKVDDANSEADDYTPVQSADKFYFSSTRKADNGGANIYSIQNPKGYVNLNINSNMNEIWIKNITRSEYLCFPKCSKINLSQGAKYQIIRPEFFSKYYTDKLPESLEFDFSKTVKDTSLSVNFNLKSAPIDNFVAISAAKTPLFIRGYWKPFDKGSFAELKKLETAGIFKNSTFVDTSVVRYNSLLGEAENNQELLLTKIVEALDNFNTFLPARDSLIINLRVLSDEIDISGYKNNYSKAEKASYIYRGETVKIGKDKKGLDLIIPDSLDITESSWMADGKKIKLSNDGNEVLAKLRAYHTYKYLDSNLRIISPVYTYYSLNKKLVFNYDGFVIDEKGVLPQDFIALTLKNRSTTTKNDKIEDLALAYDYAVKPAQPKLAPSDDPNPNRPVPKMDPSELNISKIKMLKIMNAYRLTQSTESVPEKQDTSYVIELFNLQDYKTAKRAFDILESKLVKDIKFTTAYDFLGKPTYLIRADKFATLPDCENALRDYRWVYSYVNVEGMPIAVRE
ncbi:MAG: hypothetical protein WCR42_11860 [bacterium]